ncbi:protein mono-ADP-ribosyltransferase PARP12-like [Saccostrea echinata]|uniref:protein mono-ADP-ribosyltransferase PARP12-like n=1 Tax=Saccostrea echinata TaxID=191078 RepID=UPI002A8234CD|nr:protein mono-ADP-ribosyltransferase PARP12-like [Saccostrea echinata]
MNTYRGKGRKSAGSRVRGYRNKWRENECTRLREAGIKSEDESSADDTTDHVEPMDVDDDYSSSYLYKNIWKENVYFIGKANRGPVASDFSEESVFNFLVKRTGGLSSVSKFSEEYPHLPGNFTEWLSERKERLTIYKREQTPICMGPFLKNATLCFHHTGIGKEKECSRGNCCHFHICKFYLNGFCRNGYKCRKEHDFTNGHNTKIKEKLGLEDFNDEDIKVLILCRYPQVCRARTCLAGEDCPFLHICYNFITNRCEDPECERGHSFETPHNRWVLSVYKMERWPREKLFLLKSSINMPRKQLSVTYLCQTPSVHPSLIAAKANTKLKEVTWNHEEERKTEPSEKEQVTSRGYYRQNREYPWFSRLNEENHSKSSSIFDTNAHKQSICLSGLTGGCQEKDCDKHHTRFPYLWQIRIYGDWVSFDDEENQKLEQSYCNTEDSADGKFTILENTERITLYFRKEYGIINMAGNSVEVPYRRLTTVSFAEENIPLKIGSFHTQWRWYFKNDYGQWMQYEPDLLQYTLEKKFLTGQKSYIFTRESHTLKYRVEFTEWKQINIDINKVRKIQRRPVFVSLAEVGSWQYPKLLDVAIPEPYPAGWDPLDLAHDFEWVDLEKTSREFISVETEFYTTLRKEKFQISNIYRIQNLSLWNEYKMKRANLERAQSRKTGSIDERSLFHGTDSSDTCYGICTNNFDFRLSGKNATVYGKGSYFAVSAKYSNNYTKGPVHLMFRAKVLIGNYTKGKHEMTCPPIIPGEGHKRYDSCVDDVTNPSIFVVFDRNQCYPEYLIAYKDISEGTSLQWPIPVRNNQLKASRLSNVNNSVPSTTSGQIGSVQSHSAAIRTSSSIHSGGVSKIPASSQAAGGFSFTSLQSSVGSSNPTISQTSAPTSQRNSTTHSTFISSSSPAHPNFSNVFTDCDKVYSHHPTSSKQISVRNTTPSSKFRSLPDRNRKKSKCTIQ